MKYIWKLFEIFNIIYGEVALCQFSRDIYKYVAIAIYAT